MGKSFRQFYFSDRLQSGGGRAAEESDSAANNASIGVSRGDIVRVRPILNRSNLVPVSAISLENAAKGSRFGRVAPIGIGSMPETLRALTEVHCQIQKMTLEAALTGNKKLALEALMLDPLCAKLAPSQIRKLGLDLMAATKSCLPQF